MLRMTRRRAQRAVRRVRIGVLQLALIGLVWFSSAHSIFAFDLAGDLKLFQALSGAPRGLESLGGESVGALTSRLKLKQSWRSWSVEGHALLAALGSPSAASGPFSLSPNVAQVGEALPLSYDLVDEGAARALYALIGCSSHMSEDRLGLK